MNTSASTFFEPTGSDKASQCAVVLSALRLGPQSTLDLRSLGIMSPAARVLELRQRLSIATLRTGRCAVYVLSDEVTA